MSNTDYVMENTFFIGVYPGLDREQIDYMIDRIGRFIGSR